MKNVSLGHRTIADIDGQVDKVLRGLGNPEPPIDLRVVRDLLKLDRGYYSTTDDSLLRETFSRMKVAGLQVLLRPTLLRDAVQNLSLKALYLPDQKRILLDQDLPVLKHRWNEAHEITHDVLPWHDGIAHGDPETTLSPACHEQVESEANYGAGRLLFLGTSFEEVLRSSPCEFKLVETLHGQYGNTLTTTLWRVVELSLDPCVGLVTCHPRKATGVDVDDVKYFIRSPAFANEFGAVTAASLFTAVKGRCFGRRGPIGDGEFPLGNSRGESVDFCFETFFNGHDALTLVRRKPIRKPILTR